MVDACEDLVADLVRDRAGPPAEGGQLRVRPRLHARRHHQVGGRQRRRARHRAVRAPQPGTRRVGARRRASSSRCRTSSAMRRRSCSPRSSTSSARSAVASTRCTRTTRTGSASPTIPPTVATAMLFLDDSTLENGCLRVVPGSHTNGVWDRRTDGSPFLGNEIDATAYPGVESVPIECAAGTVVMFGSYLVHHSEPNRSDRQRRALLFSYQPAGRAHMLDALRKLAPDRRGSPAYDPRDGARQGCGSAVGASDHDHRRRACRRRVTRDRLARAERYRDRFAGSRPSA